MRPLLRQPLLLVRQFGPLKPKTAVSVRSFSQLSAVRWPSPPASASIQCQFSVLGALRLPRRAYSTTPGKDDPTKPAPESETKSEPTTTKEPTLEDSKKAALDDHPASKPPGGVPVPPKFDINNLPSVLESRRTELSKRFSHAMNDLQAAVFVAGKRLNDMTGYSAIEQMRKAIEAQGKPIATRKNIVKNFRLTGLKQRPTFAQHAPKSKPPKKPSNRPSPGDPPHNVKSMSCYSANTPGPPPTSSASPLCTAAIMPTSKRKPLPSSGCRKPSRQLMKHRANLPRAFSQDITRSKSGATRSEARAHGSHGP